MLGIKRIYTHKNNKNKHVTLFPRLIFIFYIVFTLYWEIAAIQMLISKAREHDMGGSRLQPYSLE